ncbi:MAG: hypothetical protein BGN92_15265, partial [Sphingobacteriales bacterium 41-5]
MVTEDLKAKDKNLALVIGNVMRWGVIVSLSLTFLGGLLYILSHPHEIISYKEYIEKDYSVAEILGKTFSGLLHFDGESLITFGILLLFATPVLRVLFSLIGFILEKDKLYILITLIVLAIIFISLSGG